MKGSGAIAKSDLFCSSKFADSAFWQMKLSSEPDLVVLGSRIYGDSGCKDAEVFSLSAIAHPSNPSDKNRKPFTFEERLAL